MSDPEQFKYDVRVRERMLHKGAIDDAQVKRHLDALVDLEAQSEIMTLQQPALAHADAPSPSAAPEAPAPPPPVQPPPAPLSYESPLAASPPPPVASPPQAAAPAETDSPDDDGWGS